MNPEEQIIAIAKACGWKKSLGDWKAPAGTTVKIVREASDGDAYTYPPDYLNDLNAMHEAEKTLDANEQCFYQAYLYKVVGVHPSSIFAEDIHKLFCATATQRAEAFLRVMGLYRDSL